MPSKGKQMGYYRRPIGYPFVSAGLYFVGHASTTTFGPVVRFVFGADFTSRRIYGNAALPRVAGLGLEPVDEIAA